MPTLKDFRLRLWMLFANIFQQTKCKLLGSYKATCTILLVWLIKPGDRVV
jgi:hypothetical protein